MSELAPVVEDSTGAPVLNPDIDPAPQVKPEVGETPEKGEKPLSRRDTIAKALEEKQTKEVSKADERSRDPATGRFINKDGSLAPADSGAAAAAQLPGRKPMPKAWKQDFAQKWQSLDPDLANFVADLEAKREQDVLAGVEKYRNLAQYAEGLREVITPREQMLTQHYGSVANGMRQLFQISDAATRDPLGFIHWFAQQRGIDLRSLMPAQQAFDPNVLQGQQPDLTPYIQQAIQPFAQRTAAIEQHLQQLHQEREAAETAHREDAVNSFFAEKDSDGSLKFPLEDELMDTYAKRVKFLRSDNPDWDYRRVLEKAYEELTWTSEELRTKRLETEAKRKEAEAKERATKELAAKKSAAVSVKGAPGTSPAASIDPSNRRALIERAVSNLQR